MTHTPTVHNPTHFEPKNYEVCNYLDNQRPRYYGQGTPAYEAEVKEWEGEMLATFGPDWKSKVHACSHCGNTRVRWVTAVRHLPTDEMVVFGSDCTHRLGFADKFAFKLALLQNKAAAEKVRFKVWLKREKFVADHPTLAEALKTVGDPVHAKNSFVHDVVSKLNYWGSLSDKQVNAVVASMARDVAYAAKVPEAEVKGDAPTGRVTVTQIVAPVRNRWLVKRRVTKVTAFSVSGAPAGGRVTVTCEGKGCPFAKRSRQVPPNGKVGFTGALDGHRLKPGAVIEVRITARGWIGKVVRYTVRKGKLPKAETLCLAAGASKPATRC